MCRRIRFVATIAALLLSGAICAADIKPVAIADFVRSSEFGTARLSPDGKHIAMHVTIKKDDRDLHLMTIYDLATLKPLTSIGMPINQLPADFHWVSNERLVVEMARDLGWREVPTQTGELLATNVDGSKQEYLYGYEMFLRSSKGSSGRDDYGFGYVERLPDKRNGTFYMREVKWSETTNRTFLYEMNATTAARKLVAEVAMPRFDFLMQNDNQARFAFGTDEENRYILKRYDNQKDEWTDVVRKTEKELFSPFAFSADNKHVFATLSRVGEPRALVRESMTSGERKTLASDPAGDIAMFQFGPRPSVPFAVGTRIGIPKLQYFDDDNAETKLHKLLSSKFPGQYVRFGTFSDDATKLLFSVASDRNPGDIYLMDRNTGKAEHLFAVSPRIDPDRMAERRPIEFKARTGTVLRGYLTLPPGRSEKKLPLVLLPHGGPIGISDTWFFDADAQFLASRGYAVLQVNYRGSSGRGPDFRDTGFGQYGTGIQEDLIDGVRWAIAEGTADADRICIFGASFGGYAAMMSVIRAPGLFKCAVGFAGVYDLPMIFTEDSTRRHKNVYNFFKRALGENRADLESISPARLAEKINVPVFLAHGEKDEIAPPEQAEAMHAALNKAGKVHEWMMVPKEGHGFHVEKNRIAFYEKLEAFLARHIGQ
ncbi:MAG: S9 family peptidase [Burkholderiales bacterium]|nr:S9 family peptidase [Burkholderiales bacterium]